MDITYTEDELQEIVRQYWESQNPIHDEQQFTRVDFQTTEYVNERGDLCVTCKVYKLSYN